VILSSGNVVYDTLSRAFACGADSFLAKPFLLSELLHQVKKCLARDQPETRGSMAVAGQRATDLGPERQF
jgi:DNA-binding response OmpR family regulator